MLCGKKAICYPGFEDRLVGAAITDRPAVIDEKTVTGKGAGTAIDFALAIVSVLKGEAEASKIKEAMQCSR